MKMPIGTILTETAKELFLPISDVLRMFFEN